MMTRTNRNHFAADSYSVWVSPGACPRTRSGWRPIAAAAKIEVLGRHTYNASLTQHRNDANRADGWVASVTVTEACTLECAGRTQMEAAKALAQMLLHDLHAINVDLGPDL